jgi:hypothetical protein
MAASIIASGSLQADNGAGATINSGTKSKTTVMSGADMGGGITQDIGIAAEALNAPADVSYPATYFIVNNDPTNFISVYVEAAGTNLIGKIYPGASIGPIPYAGQVPGLKADTATCKIQFWITEV